MRAFVCSENGPPTLLSLVDVERADLGDDDVRIEVHYFSVNFADVMAVAGVHQFPPPKPFSPGFEASGIVTQAGENATKLARSRLNPERDRREISLRRAGSHDAVCIGFV